MPRGVLDAVGAPPSAAPHPFTAPPGGRRSPPAFPGPRQQDTVGDSALVVHRDGGSLWPSSCPYAQTCAKSGIPRRAVPGQGTSTGEAQGPMQSAWPLFWPTKAGSGNAPARRALVVLDVLHWTFPLRRRPSRRPRRLCLQGRYPVMLWAGALGGDAGRRHCGACNTWRRDESICDLSRAERPRIWRGVLMM